MFVDYNRVLALLEKKDAILVDMRSPVLFRDDKVEGSVNWPSVRSIINNLTIERNKKRPVILFSASPDDAELKAAVTYSENLGFVTYVTDLRQFR